MRKAGAALAAVVIVAGCGGSGTLSKAQYQKKLKTQGGELNRAVSGLDFSHVSDLPALASKLDALQKQFDQVAGELEDLKPPKEAAADNRKIADALHKFAGGFRRIRDAARNGERKKIPTLLNGLATADREGRAASNDLKAKGYDVGVFGS
jgi:hypothetical protein